MVKDFLKVCQGSGIEKMEVNKQDVLQVCQGSGIGKIQDNLQVLTRYLIQLMDPEETWEAS